MGEILGIIQLLNPLISNEVSLVTDLPDGLEAIQTELHSISAFLKNAEVKAERDCTLQVWVRNVRFLAHDIEDVIEEYQLYKNQSRLVRLMKILSSRQPQIIANTIESIRARAVNIRKLKDDYSRRDSVVEQGQCSSKETQSIISALFTTEDSELVGVEIPKREIIDSLCLQERNSRLSILAVVGMRGLGKTTVVGSVYNDKLVKDCFPVRLWVPVPQPFKHLEILRSMIKELQQARWISWCHKAKQIDSMDESRLLYKANKYLKEKRYMIVFDNVPIDGANYLAECVKKILPATSKGSKVLITTPYWSVACAWLDGTYHAPYKIKPLPPKEAWELFCKRTFQSNGGVCPSWLQDSAHAIVQKCGGLPLAILAIGLFLSNKGHELQWWQKVHHNLGYYLQKDPQLREILKSMTHDLSYNLKPCFLYFGLFPSGPVDLMRLIRLWIAEGFVRQDGGNNLTLENLAEEYLDGLVDMSLVEVKYADRTGKPRMVGVNEFIHEIILSMFQDIRFCQILQIDKSDAYKRTQRLCVHKDNVLDKHDVEVIGGSNDSNIRCLLVAIEPGKATIIPKVLTQSSLECRLHLLKVLDLCNVPLKEIPKVVGNLLNLRYLSLKNTQIQMLPSSIGRIYNLQTLDLKHTPIQELPKEIKDLTRLRHLLMYSYECDLSFSFHACKIRGVKIPERVLRNFENLQKLAFVEVGYKTRVLKELRKLRQLRKLGITGLKLEDGEDLCAAIQEMRYLEVLNVCSRDNEKMNLENQRCPPHTLRRLYLNGPLISCPIWISKLHNLAIIRLRWSRLHVDPLESLQALPNLVELQLLEAYDGKSLQIENGGFKKLKVLNLLDLHHLESLEISEGALPLLEIMSLGQSKILQVPIGIKYLSCLKQLDFYNMPPHFTDSIRPGKPCYSIAKHVPRVFSHLMNHSERRWETYTLRD